MTLTEDEAAELAELRRRIFGPDGAVEVNPVDLDRLRSLESVGNSDPTDAVERIPDDQTTAEPAAAPLPAQVTPHKAANTAWRWWLAGTVAGVALVVIGYVIGVLSTTPEAPEALPEFGFDQTDDDLLPDTFLTENENLIPDSTRFVGRIDGYDIYLAQTVGLIGVCVVALTDSVQPQFASMGCSEGSLTTGGLRSGVAANLEIEVGEKQPELGGMPVRLSESVTAYRV
jgi:hypothetical protein